MLGLLLLLLVLVLEALVGLVLGLLLLLLGLVLEAVAGLVPVDVVPLLPVLVGELLLVSGGAFLAWYFSAMSSLVTVGWYLALVSLWFFFSLVFTGPS